MDLKDEVVFLPGLIDKVSSVTLFDDKSALKYSQDKNGMIISLPFDKRKDIDTIVVVELK